MPRPLRLDYPGALFHITARGVNRGTIFIDDSDRIAFLKILDTACERYGGVCPAYCLMDNHYHSLVQTRQGRVSSLMQHLNGSYGRWFNRRHDRSGHLFQGRYESSLVEEDAYLLEATRYVELNPCRAGMVLDPVDWEWSSYRARIGLASGPDCLAIDKVLGMFGSNAQVAVERYRDFVLSGLDGASTAARKHAEAFLGTPEFVARHAARAARIAQRQEVARHQCIAGRPTLDSLFRSVNDRSERRHQARIAFLRYGYTMAAIARRLGVHYTTVSRWVREKSM